MQFSAIDDTTPTPRKKWAFLRDLQVGQSVLVTDEKVHRLGAQVQYCQITLQRRFTRRKVSANSWRVWRTA